MYDPDFGRRDPLLHLDRRVVDSLHVIVDVKDLASTGQFLFDELIRNILPEGGDIGLNRHAGRRSGVDLRHLESPGDRGCGKSEDVYVFFKFFYLFFLFHAEALFLIDDQ